MAPYWAAGSTSSTSASSRQGQGLGRKLSCAGEAYNRLVASSTKNPIYGVTMHSAGSSHTTSSSDSSSSARHYVDPWDLENFMYLRRHWADEVDGVPNGAGVEMMALMEPDEGGSSSAMSPAALESSAQSDFYYVPKNHLVMYGETEGGRYRPESILMMAAAPDESLGPGLLNAVEEEHFFNERYDPSRRRAVRRSHSSAAAYLLSDDLLMTTPTPHHHHQVDRRRRSVACEPRSVIGARCYRTPITGGDSSGEAYEAFEDYSDEISRRLASMELESSSKRRPGLASSKAPTPTRTPSNLHRCASALPSITSAPHQVSRAPRSRASIAGPPPRPPPSRAALDGSTATSALQRRHSHCAPGWQPQVQPQACQLYNTRRASFSRGQLLAGLRQPNGHLHPAARGRRQSAEMPYMTAGSSDDCYVSDASEDLMLYAESSAPTAAGVPPVVDGFTDADLMYVQLASSLYGETYAGPRRRSSMTTSSSGYYYGAPLDCSRFQLTNYGHLKIDYSCSWRSLDRYIAHSS